MAIIYFAWNYKMVVGVPRKVTELSRFRYLRPSDYELERVEMGGEDLYLKYKAMILVPDFDGFFRQQEFTDW